MSRKEFLKCGNVKIEKQEFYFFKNAIPISDVNICKIVISEEFLCIEKGSKYFISYENKDGVTP